MPRSWSSAIFVRERLQTFGQLGGHTCSKQFFMMPLKRKGLRSTTCWSQWRAQPPQWPKCRGTHSRLRTTSDGRAVALPCISVAGKAALAAPLVRCLLFKQLNVTCQVFSELPHFILSQKIVARYTLKNWTFKLWLIRILCFLLLFYIEFMVVQCTEPVLLKIKFIN